ncbi:MAG TPA: hypothetical protein VGS11_12475 [Candidatus Bathyarchaeia archaeon]|nr:hypothetical protein [Candidatus Bathyarchaeia archaeon]
MILLMFVLVSAFIQTHYPSFQTLAGLSNVPLYGLSLFLGLALILTGIILLLIA